MSLIKKVTEKKISRRDFIKAAAASTASLALVGCGNVLTPAGARYDAGVVNGEGTWVTAACWHNCGGRCLNRALVVDGVVVRQKTDDLHPDSPEYFQNRGCPRGRSQRHQVYSADRIKYPMKRKNWQPGGGDKSLRGKDEWVRISWDEAYDILKSEINRIYNQYGPRSVLFNGNYSGEITQILGKKGGYVISDSTDSYGTWIASTTMIGTGMYSHVPDNGNANDRFDLVNAETIVLYGCNPVHASAGSPAYHIWQAKEAGAQFIYVGPSRNLTANLMEAKWIRVRPGTDTAFLLAVAYTMITEDDPETNPLIDWDFLARYAIGFDAEHLPSDAKVKENFKDYVLGQYDGQPKTPEWATEISGTPVEDIRWYAREIRKDKKVMLLHSFAAARCNGAEDLPQLFTTIGAMGGHMGKSGHATGGVYGNKAANPGPILVEVAWPRSNPIPNPCDDVIPGPLHWKAVVEGKYRRVGMVGQGTGAATAYPPEERELDIRLMYQEETNFGQTRLNVADAIKAHRKVDFIVSHCYSYNMSAQYADLVLPVTTKWEKFPELGFMHMWINREAAIFPSPVIEPLYEAKTDRDIVRELAARMGYDPQELFPYSDKQCYFDNIAGTTVMEPDGKTYVPLVTITEADIAEWGVDNKPQQGKIGLKELLEKGFYQVERHPGDNYGFIGYKDFVDDPVKNPLSSASGKIEIYCQQKADTLNAFGWREGEFKPYPTYHEPLNGFEQSFADWKNKTKGEYPFQIYTPHYLRRSHTIFNNVPQLREAFTNPVLMNSSDAKTKGIKAGDTVLLYNQHGKILRHATVTDTIMPGCLEVPHGSWLDIDEETGIDHGGTDNYLTGPDIGGFHVSGYNTVLVNIEKYDGKPIVADALKPVKMPKLV